MKIDNYELIESWRSGNSGDVKAQIRKMSRAQRHELFTEWTYMDGEEAMILMLWCIEGMKVHSVGRFRDR